MNQLNFSIAPDISPQQMPGWFLFASSLNKVLKTSVRAIDFQSYTEQNKAFSEDKIDLAYANPYDTGILVRNKNFLPIARPLNDVTEVTIVSRLGTYHAISEITKKTKVSTTENNDMRMLGLILLEPAGILKSDVIFDTAENHILSIKKLLNGDTDLAFVPSSMYKKLSPAIMKNLNPLVATTASDMKTVSHCFLLSPRLIDQALIVKAHFEQMHNDPSGRIILEDIGIRNWDILDDANEIDYMIDLIIALQA